ncbi:TPA: hypothetical protein ACJUE4_003221 [Listeria monocytogenes]
MITADVLVQSKSESHDMFGDGYRYILADIENLLVGKSDPEGRIKSRYGKELDHKAKLMIVHQFAKVGHPETNNLYEIFGFGNLTEEETFLEDKYANELLDSF